MNLQQHRALFTKVLATLLGLFDAPVIQTLLWSLVAPLLERNTSSVSEPAIFTCDADGANQHPPHTSDADEIIDVKHADKTQLVSGAVCWTPRMRGFHLYGLLDLLPSSDTTKRCTMTWRCWLWRVVGPSVTSSVRAFFNLSFSFSARRNFAAVAHVFDCPLWRKQSPPLWLGSTQ